jgi:hypothetical protein
MWSEAKAKENARETHRNRRELTATAQLAPLTNNDSDEAYASHGLR